MPEERTLQVVYREKEIWCRGSEYQYTLSMSSRKFLSQTSLSVFSDLRNILPSWPHKDFHWILLRWVQVMKTLMMNLKSMNTKTKSSSSSSLFLKQRFDRFHRKNKMSRSKFVWQTVIPVLPGVSLGILQRELQRFPSSGYKTRHNIPWRVGSSATIALFLYSFSLSSGISL